MKNSKPMMLTLILLLLVLLAPQQQARAQNFPGAQEIADALLGGMTDWAVDIFVPSQSTMDRFRQAADGMGNWGPFGLLKNAWNLATQITFNTDAEAGLIWRAPANAKFAYSPPTTFGSGFPTTFPGTSGSGTPTTPTPPTPSEPCVSQSGSGAWSVWWTTNANFKEIRRVVITTTVQSTLTTSIDMNGYNGGGVGSNRYEFRVLVDDVQAHTFYFTPTSSGWGGYTGSFTYSAAAGTHNVVMQVRTLNAWNDFGGDMSQFLVKTAGCTTTNAAYARRPMSAGGGYAFTSGGGTVLPGGTNTTASIPTTFSAPSSTGTGAVVCDFRPLNTSSNVGSLAGTVRGWCRLVCGLLVYGVTLTWLFKASMVKITTG